MRSRLWKMFREHLGLSLKCGSLFLLFVISVVVVACGANNTTSVSSVPPVTVTINLNQTFASPTSVLPPYSCGSWVTQTSPAYTPNAIVEVYAKFVQNVNGNPVGMGNAHAVATVDWPSGPPTVIPTTTTSDGLAVFQVPLQASALNHVVLIEVDFTSSDGQHVCNVANNQRAFFTAIEVSPTASPSASPSASATGTGTVNPFPTPSVTPIIPVPTFPVPKKSPTPKN